MRCPCRWRGAQTIPLRVEHPLAEAVLVDATGVHDARRAERLLLAEDLAFFPVHPGAPAVKFLERGEQREVVQPPALRIGAPRVARGAVVRAGDEPVIGQREHLVVVPDRRVVVCLAAREIGPVGQIARAQPAGFDQVVEADQVGVAREAGQALVGYSANPVGPRGNTCQTVWPAAASRSTNRVADRPRSPIPYGPGSEVGWSRMPLERGKRDIDTILLL